MTHVSAQLPGRLAGKSLPRQVMGLALWPLLEQAMVFLVGTVDVALAARLTPAPEALAATDALAVGGYLTWLIAMLLAAVAVGGSALVARAVGGRHRRLAHAALGQALLLGAAAGVVLGLGLAAGADVLALTAGPGARGVALCALYLRVTAVAAPMSAVLLVGSACLRASGDTRTPFTVMATVNLTNILASVALVWGPAPIGGHGVAGIAAGTALAWTLGAVLILVVLMRGNPTLRLRWIRLRPHPHTARRILRIGTPQFIENLGVWGANFLVLLIVRQIAGRQDAVGLIGSHLIGIRIESMSFLIGVAIATASATLTGQYLGAGDPRSARRAVMLCLKIAVGVMAGVGLMFWLIPESLTSLITRQPAQLALVPRLLMICALAQPFVAASIVLRMSLGGAGDTRATMILSNLSMFLLRLPGVYLVGIVWDGGLIGVWIVLCSEWVVRAALFGGRFAHGGWQRVQV